MEQPNPFGEKYQKYWDGRHSKWSRFDEGIQTDIEGLYSVGPEEISKKIARKTNAKIVVDGFAGVGGTGIAYAQYSDHVYVIEINPTRLAMLKNNAQIYGVDNKITFIEGDYFTEAPKIKADAMFFSPPWGGTDYIKKDKFTLSDFDPNGKDILELAFAHFPKVVLQAPKNFDISELDQFNKEYVVEDEIFNDMIIFKTIYFFIPIE